VKYNTALFILFYMNFYLRIVDLRRLHRQETLVFGMIDPESNYN